MAASGAMVDEKRLEFDIIFWLCLSQEVNGMKVEEEKDRNEGFCLYRHFESICLIRCSLSVANHMLSSDTTYSMSRYHEL